MERVGIERKLVVYFLAVRIQLNLEILIPNFNIKLDIDNTVY